MYLNFSGERHVARTLLAGNWLQERGWEERTDLASTLSSGEPNGPYSGPVYSKRAAAGEPVDLMGSNCWEGAYFVFVELARTEGDLLRMLLVDLGIPHT